MLVRRGADAGCGEKVTAFLELERVAGGLLRFQNAE
jgi:hypothetical protein